VEIGQTDYETKKEIISEKCKCSGKKYLTYFVISARTSFSSIEKE